MLNNFTLSFNEVGEENVGKIKHQFIQLPTASDSKCDSEQEGKGRRDIGDRRDIMDRRDIGDRRNIMDRREDKQLKHIK